jgi:CxxC motif-containing protein
VRKTEIFEVMKKINALTVQAPVKIGDILMENISEDISLIATGNS